MSGQVKNANVLEIEVLMVVHHHTSVGTLMVVQHTFGPIIWQSILFQNDLP